MRTQRPSEMSFAPQLDFTFRPREIRKRWILLINPFYPKDPLASFGKHVLTPTLALTSIAAATPPEWEVRYWDENLLQGPPPRDPFPEVVGITVHLTFASRAYELARWYRSRGSVVVLGGLHATSCPDEVATHADAVAVGEEFPQIGKGEPVMDDQAAQDRQPDTLMDEAVEPGGGGIPVYQVERFFLFDQAGFGCNLPFSNRHSTSQ